MSLPTKTLDNRLRWSRYRSTTAPAGNPEVGVNDPINEALVLCLSELDGLQGMDALLHPTDTALSHGESALSRRLAAAAGPGLAEECRRIGKLGLGTAVSTAGHRLPCRAVLHTALPRFDPLYRAACGAALAESLNASLRLFAAANPPLPTTWGNVPCGGTL